MPRSSARRSRKRSERSGETVDPTVIKKARSETPLESKLPHVLVENTNHVRISIGPNLSRRSSGKHRSRVHIWPYSRKVKSVRLSRDKSGQHHHYYHYHAPSKHSKNNRSKSCPPPRRCKKRVKESRHRFLEFYRKRARSPIPHPRHLFTVKSFVSPLSPIPTTETPKAKKPKTPCLTEEEVRSSTRLALTEAINAALDLIKTEKGPQLVDPASLSEEIEKSIFRFFSGVTHDYRLKGRDILFNLKDPGNADFRASLFANQITTEQLPKMDWHDMASFALKKEREENAKNLGGHKMTDMKQHGIKTDEYVCFECGNNDTEWSILHGHLHDSPWSSKSDLTVIEIACVKCPHKWIKTQE